MNLPSVKTKTIRLEGGLDLETPPISMKEGFALEANNIECNLNGGYRKMTGYERLDGREKPSDAVMHTILVDDASLESADTDITGSLSGATARVIAIDTDENLIGVTALIGDFVENDVLDGGATVQEAQSPYGHTDVETNYDWSYLAQEYYRSLIQPVPGSGDVLGVWEYNDNIYAFRSDASVVKMYCSSPTGWQEVELFSTMTFDTGVLSEGDIVAGDTITGLSSSATATVKNIIVTDGNYGSTAEGYVVIDVTGGAFTSGESIQKGGVTKFTSTSVDTEISFSLGVNKFEFVNYNFKGSESSYAMYGCDSTNNAFQFDGTVLTPIYTGMTIDAPTHIEAHKNHLFLSFDGGSLQHSSVAEPLKWSVILGAGEIGLGREIKSLKSMGGDVLLISTDQNVSGLYGTSSANWTLSLVAAETGDLGSTLEIIGTPLIVTNRGIIRLDASLKYGNFESSTVSRRINPLLREYLASKTLVGINLVRNKNQYRIYFDDGKGIILSQDLLYGQGALPNFTTFEYPAFPRCLSSTINQQGKEVVLFGDSNGYVYQEEKGNNFDGEAESYSLKLPYHHLGSPLVRKAFKWLSVEIITDKSVELRMTYEFSDGQYHTNTSKEESYDITIGDAARWDLAKWDEFAWGSISNENSNKSIRGTGTNISLFFFGSGSDNTDFTLGSITYQYVPRRILRG